MNAFFLRVSRCLLATLWIFGALQLSESKIVCQAEPEDPKIVVLGVNSSTVRLIWQNCSGDAGETIFSFIFKRQKPGDVALQQIASRGASDGFIMSDPFKDFQKYRALLDQELRIFNVQRNDEYVYTLSINYRTSGGVFEDKIFQVTVLVKDPADITHISGNQTVNETDVVTLTCSAEGIPSPNITWARVSDNSSVSFPLTITGKQDEGGYRCTADNGIGNPASQVVYIIVENYLPTDTNLNTSLVGKSVVVNTSFNITCSAQANPPAKYRFYKDQDSFVNDTTGSDVSVITTTVSERIKQVNYSCTPFNDFGDGPTDGLTLTVLCP